MTTARESHASTYIPETDSVLITGGSATSNPLCSTEIFISSNRSFVRQGNMTQSRQEHTADRISDHVVLIAGGSTVDMSGLIILASADLYDSMAVITTGTVNMTSPRYEHTSSMIDDGRVKLVLLAGGQDRYIELATGDVYNNMTGIFTAVNNTLSAPRYGHTATVIPNMGCVILAGGYSNGLVLNTLDLYNSSTNMFSPLPRRMTTRRYSHTSTYISSIQSILFAGGISFSTATGTFEVFNVSTMNFVHNGTMLSTRMRHTATLLPDETVLLVGGQDINLAILSSCELYNPLTNTFSMTGSLSVPRIYHTAILLQNSGQVLICGGQSSSMIHTSCELYRP